MRIFYFFSFFIRENNLVTASAKKGVYIFQYSALLDISVFQFVSVCILLHQYIFVI